MRQLLAVFTTILLLAIAGCGEDPAQKAEEPATQPEPEATETKNESEAEPEKQSSTQETDKTATASTETEANFDRPVGGVLPDGSGFSASGQVKCVRDKDAGDAMCDFGVVREGEGNGWVMVFWPDTGSRVIYFENGTPTGFDSSSADGDAELAASKEGDNNIVLIGESRFEIPDAVIQGG